MQSTISTAVLLFLVVLVGLVLADGGSSYSGPSLQAQVGNLLGLHSGGAAQHTRKEDFPQFMMDAYNCMNSDRFGNCLPVYHKNEVNLLRTFLGTVNTFPSKAVRAHNSRSLKNSVEIIFNVSLANREVQTIHYSMLRLYKQSLSKAQMSMVKEKCGNGRAGHINLQLYSPYDHPTSSGMAQYSLCASQSLSMAKLRTTDWIEFRNLTNTFKSLVNVSVTNNSSSRLVSMRLAVQCPSVRPQDLGFKYTSAQERPQLVEFTENDMQKETIFPKAMGLLAASQLQQDRRHKRDASNEKPVGTSPPTTDEPEAQIQMLPTMPANFKSLKCTLYHYEIVFNTTEWGESIITPFKYNANICAGLCYDHPESNIDNYHAYLQSTFHRLMPESVPPPCCVPKPDKLEPITLLTLSNSVATVQEFANMVATQCECL